ncbi:MAG: MBL fold metallo-hydrolase RNA specificity domain-containing protein [Verrucomicrobiales bacterium]
MIEVRFNRGLYLPEADLWLDPWDAKPRAFVSHAHADHFARHEALICSDVTAILIRRRFRLAESRIESASFHTPFILNGFRLRMLPAGHVTGSAMLHVTRLRDGATLLYTGDFKTRRGRTAEPVSFLNADTLIIETTFGLPHYVFPPQMEIESAVLGFVHGALADGETPVIFGYSLGKAQEALALLTEHGIPVLLHPSVADMTDACREAGAELPEPKRFEGFAVEGHAIIAPPNALRTTSLRGLRTKRTAMLTGWAMQPGAKYRYRVDEVFPMSDHADHAGLLECLQRVRPKHVLTVHGYAHEFAAELRSRRIDAWCAMGGDQLELSITGVPQRAVVSSSHSRQIRPICAFADFSDVCRLVGETSSRLAKIDFLAHYLKGLESDRDLRLAAGWLTGEAIPNGAVNVPLSVDSTALHRALLSLPGAREERYRELSLPQNDFARTARLFLQELTIRPEPLDLPGLARFFEELASSCGSLDRIERLGTRLRSLHPTESETLIKLLTGDLRIGLKEGLVEDAVTSAFKADPAAVRRAHMLTGDIGETAVFARYKTLDEADLRPFVPIKCMLASPAATINELWDWHIDSGSPLLWVEPKHRGIRLQLHKLGDRVGVFSQDLQPLDTAFPDLLAAAASITHDCVLDGVLLSYASDRVIGLTRLNKRQGSAIDHSDLFLTASTNIAPVPLRFIAFDVLWHDGQGLLELSLEERRVRLDSLGLYGAFESLVVERISQPEDLDQAFKQSLADGHDGIIAKDSGSAYHPGRRSKSWVELDGERPALDCPTAAE